MKGTSRRKGFGTAVRMLHLMPRSLRVQFLLGMGVMLLPLVVLAVIALFSLQGVTNAIDDVVQEATEEHSAVSRLQFLIQQTMIVAHDSVTKGLDDPAAREPLLQANQGVHKAFEGIEAGPFALPEERRLIQSAREEWRQGRQLSEALLANPRPSGSETVAQKMELAHAHHIRALEMLDQVHALAQAEMNAQFEHAVSVRQEALVGIASVFVVGLGIAIVVATALARSIMTPLRALESGANHFGAGDFSYRVSLTGQNELGQLGKTFNAMADKLAQSQATLRELSTHDDLTGLFNFREFHRQLTEEAERSRRYGRPFSLLMLDIDHFKAINDTYGHLAGDEALRALATLIRREVRPMDLVARYGGEEFVMVLPETTGPGAFALGERLRSRIADHAIALPTGQTIRLTVSMGLATFPEDEDSLPQLISAADQALYAAKSAGRNGIRQWSGT
jgi:two-component system cell cycle response regulator